MTVRTAVWTGILLLWAAGTVFAQSPAVHAAPATVIRSHGQAQERSLQPLRGDLVRELNDPHTGRRWLLYRDLSYPGGPGRLVEAAFERQSADLAPSDLAQSVLAPSALAQPAGEPGALDASPSPVIHLGDRVILEESTPVVEARLEATALGPALTGSRLRVRLRIGGLTVSAVALGPGRVALAPPGETRP